MDSLKGEVWDFIVWLILLVNLDYEWILKFYIY